jgi:hypothetical protein
VTLNFGRKKVTAQSTFYKPTVPTFQQIEQKRAYSIWGSNDIYITNDIKIVIVGLSFKCTASRQETAAT